MATLNSKVAIVTGSKCGIGRTTVDELLSEGAFVIMTVVCEQSELDEAVSQIENEQYKRYFND